MRTRKRMARTARRLYRLCLVDGRLDEPRVRLVMQRAVDVKRHGSVGVLGHFQRLVRIDRQRNTAIVETAVPLPADRQTRVAADVARRFGSGVTAEFVVNPDLIAGMRMQVGSAVYDGSVRGRLAQIEASL